jgi:hypothetical protein
MMLHNNRGVKTFDSGKINVGIDVIEQFEKCNAELQKHCANKQIASNSLSCQSFSG